MKKIYLSLLSFVVAISVSARERSLNDIYNAAATVLNPVSTRSTTNMQIEQRNDMLTVVGGTSGFVIIANDDAFNAVLGYSESKFCNIADNDALAWFINNATETMQRRMEAGMPAYSPTVPDAGMFKGNVEPLLATEWNQQAPYNNLCPKDIKGSSYPSGCVSTALTQIMKYYNYPTQGQGEKQYSFKPADGVGELLYANFGNTIYHWDNMLNVYAEGQYTAEQAEAVATITFHAGVAVEMQYTPSGSGAYSSEARNGLINQFLYNKNITLLYRNYFSQDEWMHKIFAELDSRRPIYYSGTDPMRGGHAFVIDGYNSDGMVHVNWGWGPDKGNGYYDIALLNPSGYSFKNGQDMLVGIALPDADIKHETHLVSDYEFTVSKFGNSLNISVGDRIWNMGGYTWTGTLAVVLQGNGQTYVLKEIPVTASPYLHDVLLDANGSLNGLTSMPKGMADGEYRLFIGAKNDMHSDWSLVRRLEGTTNNYIVNVDNGSYSIESSADDSWSAIENISTDKSYGNISTRYYDIGGQYVGTDFNALGKGVYIVNGKKVIK